MKTCPRSDPTYNFPIGHTSFINFFTWFYARYRSVIVSIAHVNCSHDAPSGAGSMDVRLALRMLPPASAWEADIERAERAERRRIAAAQPSGLAPLRIDGDDSSNDAAVMTHLTTAAFFSKVLLKHVERCSTNDDGEEEEDDRAENEDNYEVVFEKPAQKDKDVIETSSSSPPLDFIDNEMLDCCVLLFRSVSSAPQGDITPVLNGLSLRSTRAVLSRLLDRSFARGFGWAVALGDFLRGLSSSRLVASKMDQMVARRNTGGEGDDAAPGNVHTMQVRESFLFPFSVDF